MSDDRFEDPEFIRWAKAVKVKDNFTCQICNKRGVYLHAHHINSWDKYADQRFDLDNGITLCQYHHERFHDIYGYGNNSSFQFEEYKEIIETFKRLLSRSEEDVVFPIYKG